MHPKTSKILMIVSKLSFLSLILYAIITQGWKSDLLDIIVFLGLFILTYLGTKNPEFYKIDAASNALFALASIGIIIGLKYNTPYMGYDKILHFTAGFILAWSVYIIFKNKIKDKKILLLNAVTFAIAIGALWEIFEFTMDMLPAPYRVVSLGYTDTMLDIVADSLGAIVFCTIILIFLYYAKGHTKDYTKKHSGTQKIALKQKKSRR